MTLAEHIQQDLAARIGSDSRIPPKMTIAGLAKEYGVSFTPVRQAVDALVDGGYLIKGLNGRLNVSPERLGAEPDRDPLPERPVPDGLGLERAVTEHCLRMSLSQHDDFLREEALAREYDVSRTVVRQVFHQLSGAGIVQHVPRRGWKVHPFRPEDVAAFIDIRETLERKAFALARPHLEPNQLREMLNGNCCDENGGVSLDNRLHSYFVEKCGNRFIAEFFRHQGRYYLALFDYATLGSDFAMDMASQHRRILELTLEQRWDEAGEELSRHIRDQQPILEARLVAGEFS